MGILAPLERCRETEHQCIFSTGFGTLTTGLLFLFFAAVLAGMRLASLPLLSKGFSEDRLLGHFLPLGLAWLSLAVAFLGFCALGYRQKIIVDRAGRRLEARLSTWGVPFLRRRFVPSGIPDLEIRNVTPRGYRPQPALQNKPVGFWELRVRTPAGKSVLLDRAPRPEEIRQIYDKILAYWQG